jgi:hypothetical protein
MPRPQNGSFIEPLLGPGLALALSLALRVEGPTLNCRWPFSLAPLALCWRLLTQVGLKQ